MIALIPARAGSKRVPHKNMRKLAGRPLVDYSVFAAMESGIFSEIIISTDMTIGWAGGDGVKLLNRPTEYAGDSSPDIEWVRHALSALTLRPDAFAILRPTSPFRTAETIRRAYRAFTTSDGTHDSLRAVEPVTQNPYKMWTWQGPGFPMLPILKGDAPDRTPLHSSASQLAPPVWIQNSSLEMSYTSNVEHHGTIAGRKIIPFFTEGHEGLSIDTEDDWRRAEALAAADPSLLPQISLAPVSAGS